MASLFIKDPDAVLDYYWDWAATTNNSSDNGDWLESGETISTYTVTADTGLTKDSDEKTNSDTTIKAWFSGGTVGTEYDVVCHIVTSAGREDDRTITIRVEER